MSRGREGSAVPPEGNRCRPGGLRGGYRPGPGTAAGGGAATGLLGFDEELHHRVGVLVDGAADHVCVAG